MLLMQEPMLQIDVEVGTPVSVGVVDGHEIRMVPINGGRVSGRYSGTVLPGGADWQTVVSGRQLEIQARYLLKLEGGIVEVRSEGVRSGSQEALGRLGRGEQVPADEYYFRTFIRFRTASNALEDLNCMLAISVAERLVNLVRLSIFEVR